MKSTQYAQQMHYSQKNLEYYGIPNSPCFHQVLSVNSFPFGHYSTLCGLMILIYHHKTDPLVLRDTNNLAISFRLFRAFCSQAGSKHRAERWVQCI